VIELRTHRSMREFSEADWDGLLASQFVPHMRWAFLEALEATGCVRPEVGWLPQHLSLHRDGKLIAVIGKKGTGPGEFDQPHALAFDSKGRLFVGDRSNNRIQILDQQGRYIDEWKQFSRPSGIYIDKNDVIYVSDSESGAVGNGRSRTEKRGIRVGGLSDGKVIALIPDPVEVATNTSAAEGVAADIDGNIYGAEVGPKALKKYVKR